MRREVIHSVRSQPDDDIGRDPVEIALMVIGVIVLAAIVVMNAAWMMKDTGGDTESALPRVAMVTQELPDASAGELEWDWVFWNPTVESVVVASESAETGLSQAPMAGGHAHRLAALAALLMRVLVG